MNKKNGADTTRVIWSEVELPDGDRLVSHSNHADAIRCDPPEFGSDSSAFELDELPTLVGSTPLARPALHITEYDTAKLTSLDTHRYLALPDSSAALEEVHLTMDLFQRRIPTQTNR